MPSRIVCPAPTGPPMQFNITHGTQGGRRLWRTDSDSLSLSHTKPPVMSGQIKGRILWQWATLLCLVCHAAQWSCGEGKVWPRSSHPLPGYTQLHTLTPRSIKWWEKAGIPSQCVHDTEVHLNQWITTFSRCLNCPQLYLKDHYLISSLKKLKLLWKSNVWLFLK